MSNFITNSRLTAINIIIVSYFLLLWLVDFYNVSVPLFDVFRELITIPFLIAQLIFLLIGITFVLKGGRQILTIASIILLSVCTALTMGSLFKLI